MVPNMQAEGRTVAMIPTMQAEGRTVAMIPTMQAEGRTVAMIMRQGKYQYIIQWLFKAHCNV